jgi:peptide/nickel transport system substrate-binding protein
MGYKNPEADKLLDEARVPSDLAARKAIYEKLTKFIVDDLPKIYLYHRRILIAHSAKLEGYTQLADGLVRVVGLRLK